MQKWYPSQSGLWNFSEYIRTERETEKTLSMTGTKVLCNGLCSKSKHYFSPHFSINHQVLFSVINYTSTASKIKWPKQIFESNTCWLCLPWMKFITKLTSPSSIKHQIVLKNSSLYHFDLTHYYRSLLNFNLYLKIIWMSCQNWIDTSLCSYRQNEQSLTPYFSLLGSTKSWVQPLSLAYRLKKY